VPHRAGQIARRYGTNIIRTRAGRSDGHVESVCPFDELDGDDEGDREGNRVETMVDESVGVAVKLMVEVGCSAVPA
jgi:hypothetical protein